MNEMYAGDDATCETEANIRSFFFGREFKL